MRTVKRILASSFMVPVIAVGLGITSCDDTRSTGPVLHTAIDPAVYFYGGDRSAELFSFRPLSSGLEPFGAAGEPRCSRAPCPSPTDPVFCGGAAVPADGSRLYFLQDDDVRVVRPPDLQEVARLPHRASSVVVSPDDKFVALFGDGLSYLYLLTTANHELVFRGDRNITSTVFSRSCKSLYGCGNCIYKVDLDNDFAVTKRYFAERAVAKMVPSLDESKWYLCVGNPDSVLYKGPDSIMVYDVAVDSIVSATGCPWRVGGIPDIELSPDGRYLFYCVATYTIECGPIWPAPPQPSFVMMAFAVTNDPLTRLAVPVEGVNIYGSSIPNIELTRDGRWLAGITWNPAGVATVDVETMQGRQAVVLEGYQRLWGLTTQAVP